MVNFKEVTQEQLNYGVDANCALTIEELSQDLNVNRNQMFYDLIMSDTGRLLYDEPTKTWWDGPSNIAQMYKDELLRKSKEDRLTKELQQD